MKSINSLVIVGNGSLALEELKYTKNYDYLIATDLAAIKLIKLRIIPDLCIGDFDSISKSEFDYLKNKISKIKSFPKKKDITDLELAVIEGIKIKPAIIDIFGATGSRLDHTLAAVLLLEKYSSQKIKIKVINSNNEIYLLNKSLKISKTSDLKYISLLSLTPTSAITLEGFHFNLKEQNLLMGSTLGISNQLKSKLGKITVHRGKVLLIQSRD